jgi:uncharacterized protein
MIGKLSNTEIEEVLKDQLIGRIGCHADDTTYIVPVSYAYDGEYIYVISKTGMKVELMRQNPRVCFQVECLRDMGNWKTVISQGTFEEINDPSEREEALNKLLQRRLPFVVSETVQLTPNWPFKPADINSISGVVFRIHLNEKSGRFEDGFGGVVVSKSFL